MKIINVLKDDTLAEILDIFRKASPGEVIFVLPKSSKVFSREDHFAAFAAEAESAGKTVSVMCSNPKVATLARKHGFTVMAGSKPLAPRKPKATLAANPPPADDDVQDVSEDAYQSDVVVPSDETMNVRGQDEGEEEADPLHGMHVEEDEEESREQGDREEPTDEELTKEEDADADFVATKNTGFRATLTATGPLDGVRRGAKPTDVPVKHGAERVQPVPLKAVAAEDLDYIDAVWRDKGGTMPVPNMPMKRPAPQQWHGDGIKFSRRVTVGILAAAVVVLGVVVYLTTGNAAIAIVPIASNLDEQLSVQASDVFSSVDSTFNKLPGQLITITKTATRSESATGTRDVASKARGTMTVSNEYSSTPQTLIATTRFVTASGLVFRTLQSVTVPGSTVSKGKPVAGTVQVDVIADKPGPAYNVSAGKFTIAAFQEKGDTERAAKIYGTSSAAMSGGASGPSKVVTQADYDKAKADAIADLKQQIADAVAQQSSELRVIDNIEPSPNNITATARPDDAADNVSVTATATLTTIAFRQSDLDQLLRDAILKKDHRVVVPDQLQVSFDDVAFNADTGILSFVAAVNGPAYTPVDIDAVKTAIRGKANAQVRDYLAHQDNIATATLSLSPFWVTGVPNVDSRITVDVNYVQPSPSVTP